MGSRYYANGRLGGLSLEGKMPGMLGELVQLRVKIGRPKREFEVKGQLGWARHRRGGAGGLPEAYGVDFLEDAERLLQFARAEVDAKGMRVEARIATDLKVRIVTRGHTRSEFLIDISPGGAFVRSALPLQVGTDVELRLRPPRALLGFTLKGRVAWHRMTGQDTGYGVEFIEPDSERLTKLLAKLT